MPNSLRGAPKLQVLADEISSLLKEIKHDLKHQHKPKIDNQKADYQFNENTRS